MSVDWSQYLEASKVVITAQISELLHVTPNEALTSAFMYLGARPIARISSSDEIFIFETDYEV